MRYAAYPTTLATVEQVKVLGPALFQPTKCVILTQDGHRLVVPRRWVI